MNTEMASASVAANEIIGEPTARKILVVEDEELLRQLALVALVRAGYDVDTAEDGQAAWEAMQDQNYDLVITDNNMPRLSGLQFVEKLRAEHFSIPVIMATGTVPNAAPELHIEVTLTKPYSSEDLVKAVKSVMEPGTGPSRQAAQRGCTRQAHRPFSFLSRLTRRDPSHEN
jgi:two-component system, chemotaxis family, chemotaxis protein CheY